MPLIRLAHSTSGVCHMAEASSNKLQISASVGRGGRNVAKDVRTIQEALNDVSPAQGGPLKRLDVDGLIGPLTIGAIERFQKTTCGFERPDGRVDPGQRTIHHLSSNAGQNVLETIYAKLPEAVSWINAARRVLFHATHQLQGFTFALGDRELRLVNKYFHLDQLPEGEAFQSLRQIDEVFRRMLEVIAHKSPFTQIGTGYFQLDPTRYCDRGTSLAATVPGGYQLKGPGGKPAVSTDFGQKEYYRVDAIYLCVRLSQASDERFTHVIVHELAHFVGPAFHRPDRIRDFSYFRKPGFAKLTPRQSMRTADSYAAFAGESKLKRELAKTKF